jgi:hypothetical protein
MTIIPLHCYLHSINDLSLDRWRGPLMSRTPLCIEVVLKVDTVLEDRIILGPILVAVLEYLTDISLKLRRRSILTSVHLALDGAQVHGPLDDVEVVGDIIDSGINGVLEGSDETSPEAGALEHSHDEIAAELHLLLWAKGMDFRRDLRGNAAVVAGTAVGLRFASSLLGGRWLDLDGFITKWHSRNGDFGFAASLCQGSWLFNINLTGIEMKLVLLSLRSVGRCGWEITHDDDEFAEDLLWEGLCERVANLRGGAHCQCQQRSS